MENRKTTTEFAIPLKYKNMINRAWVYYLQKDYSLSADTFSDVLECLEADSKGFDPRKLIPLYGYTISLFYERNTALQEKEQTQAATGDIQNLLKRLMAKEQNLSDKLQLNEVERELGVASSETKNPSPNQNSENFILEKGKIIQFDSDEETEGSESETTKKPKESSLLNDEAEEERLNSAHECFEALESLRTWLERSFELLGLPEIKELKGLSIEDLLKFLKSESPKGGDSETLEGPWKILGSLGRFKEEKSEPTSKGFLASFCLDLLGHCFYLLGELWTEADDVQNSVEDFLQATVLSEVLLNQLLNYIQEINMLKEGKEAENQRDEEDSSEAADEDRERVGSKKGVEEPNFLIDLVDFGEDGKNESSGNKKTAGNKAIRPKGKAIGFLWKKVFEVLERFDLSVLKLYGVCLLKKEFGKALELVKVGLEKHRIILGEELPKEMGENVEKDFEELRKKVRGRGRFLEEKKQYLERKISAKSKEATSVKPRSFFG